MFLLFLEKTEAEEQVSFLQTALNRSDPESGSGPTDGSKVEVMFIWTWV